MGDPLSVSASIVALVSAGVAVAKGLHQLADGIGSAGSEIRTYASEIDSFSNLLDVIKEEIIARPQNVSSKAERLFEDIVDICGKVLDPINVLQASLNPLLVHFKDSPKRRQQIGLRIQWYFSTKDKLLFFRGALRNQHRLLDTTLAALTYLAASKESREIIYIQQASIENSIQGIQSTLDQPKSLLQGNGSARSHSLLTNSGPTRPASNSSSISRNASQDISNEDARVIDQIVEKVINQPFDEEAEGIWEESRVVSRKTLQYASDALHQGPTKTPNAEQPRAAQRMSKNAMHSNREHDQWPVTFEIPGGMKHQFPYSAVRDWDSMKTTLKTVQYPQFSDRKTGRPRFVDDQPFTPERGLIDNDEFEVIDFQSRNIGRELWAKSVTPGSFMLIRMKDNIRWDDGRGADVRSAPAASSKSGAHRLGLGSVKNKIFGKTASTA